MNLMKDYVAGAFRRIKQKWIIEKNSLKLNPACFKGQQ
jgi:hypothetical protein